MPYDTADFAELPILLRDPKSLTTPAERLLYLRDFLRMRVRPDKFNMMSWISNWHKHSAEARAAVANEECGTTACLGGWTNTLWPLHINGAWSSADAAEVLGLDSETARDLFFGRGVSPDVTPAQAANVLTHLINTGKVDWSKA